MGDGLARVLSAGGLAGLVLALHPSLRLRWRGLAAIGSGLALAGLVWFRVRAGQDPSEAQQLLNGLFLGSIYALIALGYTMVYGVLKLINFAHGEVFMVGAYTAFFILTMFQSSPPFAVAAALLAAMAVCALLGVAIERAAYRPLRRAPRLAALITAIGVSLLLQNMALILCGASPKTVPTLLRTTPLPGLLERTGLIVNLPNLVTVTATILLLAGLQYFVSRTRTGRAMRAVSEDREAAQMMGINVDRIIAVTFVIGSALAGAGGVLWGLRYPSVTPDLGVLPGLKAFVAAVLGGIGSIPGATIGGLLIGLIEVLITTIDTSPAEVCAVILFLLLLIAFWRLGQTRLRELPHTFPGRLGSALGMALLMVCCWLVAQLAGETVGGWLSARPTDRFLSGSTFRDAVVFTILIVILIVKPTGLMGRYAPEKV